MDTNVDSSQYSILAVSGSLLYDCDETAFDLIYRQILRNLPLGSYVVLPRGVRFTKSLEDLRLGSLEDFRSHCQAVVDRTDGENAIERSTSTGKLTPKGRRIAKAQTSDKLTFEGPTNVLHIFKGTIACRRRGHKVEAATGYVSSVGGRQFMMNTNWCRDCGMYFIGYSEYMHYRERYGPILGNFDFKGFAISGGTDGYAGYAKESPLMLCGYNVNKAEGLSAKERHLILANIMDRHILSKPRVIEYLNGFIRDRKRRPNMQEACEKWEADLDWVRHYRIESQRSFTVAEIRRFR